MPELEVSEMKERALLQSSTGESTIGQSTQPSGTSTGSSVNDGQVPFCTPTEAKTAPIHFEF